jgi:hypothetical protein
MGNSTNSSLTRPFYENNGTNGTNGTTSPKQNGHSIQRSKPPEASRLIVDRYLALATAGKPDALSNARTYMAGNAGYDWSEQIAKAEALEATP